jgi:hypothetical protein
MIAAFRVMDTPVRGGARVNFPSFSVPPIKDPPGTPKSGRVFFCLLRVGDDPLAGWGISLARKCVFEPVEEDSAVRFAEINRDHPAAWHGQISIKPNGASR